MRYFFLTILALCSIYSQAEYAHANFARSSALATGKWVKVGIQETGVYEISYEELRNMGFSNPRRVGLYGRGGQTLDRNFTSSGGKLTYQDDLIAVPVYHEGEKMYFYGNGTSAFSLTVNTTYTTGGGYAKRTSKNIYSDTGYYFLSDYKTPEEMTVVNSATATSLSSLSQGIGIVYHETDLYHNNSNTGQLFYGEKLSIDNPRLEFDTYFPDAIPNGTGYMECFVYTDKIKDTVIRYGIEGSTGNAEIKVPLMTSTDFVAHTPTSIYLPVPSADSKTFVDIDFNGEDMDVSNLDYFSISYARSIPTLTGRNGEKLAQDRIWFPNLPRPKSAQIRIPNGVERIVFDITDPLKPKYIDLVADGIDGIARITTGESPSGIVVFDPLMPQYRISSVDAGASEVTNQDIHYQATQGADLIIICIPQLKEAAERLANVHRRELNQRVLVATSDEVYNEFSGGLPDPMAYRALVKMAYTSDYGCKNLLLLGPLYADFRGISSEKNPHEGLIAIQSTTTNQLRGGFNTNDFYGLMMDYMGTKTLESCTIPVGVGIIPARYPAEVDTYIDKISAYLNRTDFAYTLNKYLLIGGYGDADLHTSQVPDVIRNINNYQKGLVSTPLITDAYGFEEGHNQLFKAVDEGVSFISYFGHGNPVILNHEGGFFTSPDVMRFRNRTLPFWGFAGCELSEPDKGIRGMGESIVLSTPYGMIGTLIATRETWSSQNLDFFKKFHANLLRNGGAANSPLYETAPTIGEIYAGAKTSSSYANELAYQLVCDPAIIIPTVNREIFAINNEVEAQAGEWVEFQGVIASHDGQDIDTSFNGEVVIRLMEPAKTEACPHVIMKYDTSETIPEDPVLITYDDAQMAVSTAEVINGEFSVRMLVPTVADKFVNQTGKFYFCAYDASSRMGAAGTAPVTFSPLDPETSPVVSDQYPPRIEILEYLPERNVIHVRVSDDVALAYDNDPFRPPFRMKIDNTDYTAGTYAQPTLVSTEAAYDKYIPLSNLSEGSHSAWVYVRDAAGNFEEEEIVFDYALSSSKYVIGLKHTAVDEVADIVALGTYPSDADIIILNNSGFIVRREKFVDGTFSWDGTNQDGERVAPGLYKAYILETGDALRKGHSDSIDIPVI